MYSLVVCGFLAFTLPTEYQVMDFVIVRGNQQTNFTRRYDFHASALAARETLLRNARNVANRDWYFNNDYVVEVYKKDFRGLRLMSRTRAFPLPGANP